MFKKNTLVYSLCLAAAFGAQAHASFDAASVLGTAGSLVKGALTPIAQVGTPFLPANTHNAAFAAAGLVAASVASQAALSKKTTGLVAFDKASRTLTVGGYKVSFSDNRPNFTWPHVKDLARDVVVVAVVTKAYSMFKK
ncbi:hypothetical protein KBD08_04445 [Candidatus Babeliales bacterium]|nr:hypothetical protein [Candidatus Babeliales bacterium]